MAEPRPPDTAAILSEADRHRRALAIAREVVDDGKKPAAVAERYGMQLSYVYKLARMYKEGRMSRSKQHEPSRTALAGTTAEVTDGAAAVVPSAPPLPLAPPIIAPPASSAPAPFTPPSCTTVPSAAHAQVWSYLYNLRQLIEKAARGHANMPAGGVRVMCMAIAAEFAYRDAADLARAGEIGAADS